MVRSKLFAAVVLAGAFTLAACGSSGKKASLSSAPPSTAPATTVATAATGAASASGLVAIGSTSLGNVIVDSNGMTLYRFDKDSGGTIACTGACVSTWPPVIAPVGRTAV